MRVIKNMQISNLLNLGIQAANIQDYKLAEKYFSDIINLDNKNENAYYNRATSKYKLTMYKEAIEDYDKAIELNPNKAENYFGKATSYSEIRTL
ncbi:tetratricopeptide repeat protein [Brachyspira hyodysenteriae]|uniref:tetratricopeptide repeat protein n=1 Tax=Brachyspira hyodysenteriae TaxID=159 RepID=UPI0022CD550B|nr:tetratricopeptide repeat protein [Brachyspira hyodysenteriae]MCZ9981576.1 tetratricopeptide repeat protein [Brachyspira hyodysenteriae]